MLKSNSNQELAILMNSITAPQKNLSLPPFLCSEPLYSQSVVFVNKRRKGVNQSNDKNLTENNKDYWHIGREKALNRNSLKRGKSRKVADNNSNNCNPLNFVIDTNNEYTGDPSQCYLFKQKSNRHSFLVNRSHSKTDSDFDTNLRSNSIVESNENITYDSSNASTKDNFFHRDFNELDNVLLLPQGSTLSDDMLFIESSRKDSPWYECEDPILINGDKLVEYPNSLLSNHAKRKRFWHESRKEYFFDRHQTTFESILHIYQTCGQVIRPEFVPISVFLEELSFYEMGDDVIENFWISEGYQKPAPAVLPTNQWQRLVWKLMEHPDSSIIARILAFVSIFVIIISIVSFCLETLPELKRYNDTTNREWSSPFFWIEFFCSLWFSVELLVRFVSAPSKKRFMKSFLNVLDFVAVAPFFINLLWISFTDSSASTTSSPSFAVLRIIRLVRVFRVFKLSRHSVGLQVLGKTFRASVQEFCLLMFFMGIALILFSSGVYFAEQNEPDTKFTSIPASFWFVLATMTTVGYGDLVPTGLYGKIVGSCCALIGVLTLALPVPIIVANFKHFYRQECKLAQIYRQQQIKINAVKEGAN